MIYNIIFLLLSLVSISAFGMQPQANVYPEKLGNPWAQALDALAAETDPASVPLFEAIGLQDINAVKAIVAEQPILLESRNQHGITPLHFAANFNSLEVIQILLDMGASVNADSPVGTPLHLAASEGHCDIITLLLARGADVHARDQWGRTPLFDAIYDLNYAATALLMGRGAAYDILEDGGHAVVQDNMGRTPLHVAVVRLNEVEYCKNSLKGADLETLLHPNPYIIKYLTMLKSKNCLAKLLFSKVTECAEIQDRLGKTPYEYQRLVNLLPLTDAQKAKKNSSFMPAPLPARKSPTKKSPKSPKHNVRITPPKVQSPKELVSQQKTQEPVPVSEVGAVHQETAATPELATQLKPNLFEGYFSDRFDGRVREWFANTHLSSLLNAGAGWWHTQAARRKLQYHQIPFTIIDDVFRFGKEELRDHSKPSKKQERSWSMHGCMLFDDGMHNPWCPGKSKQEGFYHCTQGRDGKIYHIGFDPIQEGALLASYFPEAFIQETIKTKIYDTEQRVTHLLYA